ncbi:MAG TPA: hypothetical protein DCG49_00025 [Ruminococcus sp.]|nr:hypothetical protein [Ruminococcus sp.]
MLRFRKLKPADLPKTDWRSEPLSALLPDGAAYFAQTLEAGDTLFVIFDEGKPVGVLEMDREPFGEKPQCANVGLVMLLPEYRRHGLGRMLMVLAAGEAVERKLWFLSGAVPDDADAKAFAAAIHLNPTEWFTDRYVLDLSDVEGLRYGRQ